MRRFVQTLIPAIPSVVGLAAHATDTTPTIEVTLSRFAFSPERIKVPLGERVRFSFVSTDGTHGFQVKALGLDARIPAGGRATTVEYCVSGHRRMRASLTVGPDT